MSNFDHLPLQIGDSLVLLQDIEFVDAEGDTFTVKKGAVFEVDSMDWNNGYYREYGYHAIRKTETHDEEICVKHADYGVKFTKYTKYLAKLESKLKDLMADLQIVKTAAGRDAINAHICEVNAAIMQEKGLLTACTCDDYECCPECSPEE